MAARTHSLLKRWFQLLSFAAAVFASAASAQLSIEITGGGANRVPIAIVPFAGEGAFQPGIVSIVRADLERSGLFRVIEPPPIVPAPTEASAVNFPEWRSRLADVLVMGSVAVLPDGRFEVRFRVFDVVKQVALGGVAYTLNRN